MPSVPPLTDIYFYITGRCNLQCSHCWISAGEEPSPDSELSTEEVRDIIDQAIPLGLRAIKITGGEPFMRDDIVDILEYAASKGLRSRVETNGTLLEDETIERLARIDGFQACVSLDGATPETHAKLRGSRAVYHSTVRALEALAKNGVPTQIITVVHKGNVDEIEDITAMADELGIGLHKINQLNSMGRGTEMVEAGEALSIEEVLEFNHFVEDHLNVKYSTAVRFDIPIVFQSPDIIRKFASSYCSIQNILGVLSDGRLSICGIGEEIEELIFANVHGATVREVWEGNKTLIAIRRDVESEREGLCQRCMLKKYCMGGYCRAFAYARYGSFRAPYPFCQDSFDAGLFPAFRLLDSGSTPSRREARFTPPYASGCWQL